INKLITVAPCSRWFTKQFPLHKAKQLIINLIESGYSPALIGGIEDTDYCNQLEKDVSVLNLSGKLSPLQSFLIINKSRLLVTVDSAAQHLGSASKTPIILIYGSTNLSFGFYPLTSENKIIEINNLSCRPCTDHGRDSCPKGHFKCMEDIEISSIMQSVNSLIKIP
ncbi:MAG TPA: glycosyltransferase family 9 protein, partial [Ignavibacteria bacterium]